MGILVIVSLSSEFSVNSRFPLNFSCLYKTSRAIHGRVFTCKILWLIDRSNKVDLVITFNYMPVLQDLHLVYLSKEVVSLLTVITLPMLGSIIKHTVFWNTHWVFLHRFFFNNFAFTLCFRKIPSHWNKTLRFYYWIFHHLGSSFWRNNSWKVFAVEEFEMPDLYQFRRRTGPSTSAATTSSKFFFRKLFVFYKWSR